MKANIKEITLKISQILDLAKFCQLVPHKATLAEILRSDEEGDTEYTIIETEGGMVIQDDDKTPRRYAHGAYLSEYPEEGTYPLGGELPTTCENCGEPATTTDSEGIPLCQECSKLE